MYFSRKTEASPKAESGFVLRFFEARFEVGGLAHDAHAAAAAAHGGFDDDGIADLLGELAGFGGDLTGVSAAGQDGHAGGLGEAARGGLVAEEFEQFRRGADEGDAGVGAGAGEDGILGEEAVAGVDGVDALRSTARATMPSMSR